MTVAQGLLVQSAVTEILSVASFWLGSGFWFGGAVAPFWGLAAPLFVILDLASPITGTPVWSIPVLVLFATLVVLSVRGAVPRLVGHASLLLFNLASVALFLTLA